MMFIGMRSISTGFLAAAILGSGGGSASATTIHTSSFISAPTNTDGFESLGDHIDLPYNTVFSEGGIDARYVGSDGLIWTGVGSEVPGTEGNYSWYMYGSPSSGGYTQIKLSSGADINSIQFLAGAGYHVPVTKFQFQLLNDGALVDEGVIDFYGAAHDPGPALASYGFSDAVFDEVRLQSLIGGGSFNPTGYDALALDSIAIGPASVAPTPLPAALPLFASAIGGLGFVGWRRKRRADRT